MLKWKDKAPKLDHSERERAAQILKAAMEKEECKCKHT